MLHYDKAYMINKLLKAFEKNEQICVWDFPNYDEHEVSEIEEILDAVDECINCIFGYITNRYEAPACGWGLASRVLISAAYMDPYFEE